MPRTWRATAKLLFPTDLVGADAGQRIVPISRIPLRAADFDGALISLEPLTEPAPDLRTEWARLLVQLTADDVDSAFVAVEPIVEAVLESLSFQLQYVLQVTSLEILDVTPPLVVGDEREMRIFPQGPGYSTLTFVPASVSFGVQTIRVPDLSRRCISSNPMISRALDWFLKGLAAALQVDRFIFFWIAAEILAAGSPDKVEAPYQGRCGHLIPNCPTCDATTARPVQRKSMESFLVQSLGLTADAAKRTWQLRQMLHGAIAMDSPVMDELPELTSVLHAGLVQELKVALNMPIEGPPFIAVDAMMMRPGLLLSGSRWIDESDLTAFGQRGGV